MRVRLEHVCERGASNLKQSDIVDDSGNYPIYGASGHISNVDFYHQNKPYVAVVKDGAGIGRTTLHPAKSSVIGTMQYLIPKKNVLPEYLYYVVCYMHLEKYFTGATIPHIYFKDYKNEQFNLDSLEKQKEIIDILGKCENVINVRKKELQKLDKLIKARFVEMFVDTNDKYEKWPLSNSVEEMFIGPFGSSLKNEMFVDKEEAFCMVYEQKHAIQKTLDLPARYVDRKKFNELKRFTVMGGDIIVSCRGTIGEIYSLPENSPIGIMHPSIMKIRLKPEKYCNAFFELMLSEFMKDNIEKNNGSGIKMAITAKDLGKEAFILPPLKKQMQFEEFVSHVNKSKVKVQKALDEAQLLFDSLMQKYFG